MTLVILTLTWWPRGSRGILKWVLDLLSLLTETLAMPPALLCSTLPSVT